MRPLSRRPASPDLEGARRVVSRAELQALENAEQLRQEAEKVLLATEERGYEAERLAREAVASEVREIRRQAELSAQRAAVAESELARVRAEQAESLTGAVSQVAGGQPQPSAEDLYFEKIARVEQDPEGARVEQMDQIEPFERLAQAEHEERVERVEQSGRPEEDEPGGPSNGMEVVADLTTTGTAMFSSRRYTEGPWRERSSSSSSFSERRLTVLEDHREVAPFAELLARMSEDASRLADAAEEEAERLTALGESAMEQGRRDADRLVERAEARAAELVRTSRTELERDRAVVAAMRRQAELEREAATNAREEAEKILHDARSEAEEMSADVKAECARVLESVRTGADAQLAGLRREFDVEVAALRDVLDSAVASLDRFLETDPQTLSS